VVFSAMLFVMAKFRSAPARLCTAVFRRPIRISMPALLDCVDGLLIASLLDPPQAPTNKHDYPDVELAREPKLVTCVLKDCAPTSVLRLTKRLGFSVEPGR
jgi:hypothetical protein